MRPTFCGCAAATCDSRNVCKSRRYLSFDYMATSRGSRQRGKWSAAQTAPLPLPCVLNATTRYFVDGCFQTRLYKQNADLRTSHLLLTEALRSSLFWTCWLFFRLCFRLVHNVCICYVSIENNSHGETYVFFLRSSCGVHQAPPTAAIADLTIPRYRGLTKSFAYFGSNSCTLG